MGVPEGVNPVLGLLVAVPLAEEVAEGCAPNDKVAVDVPVPLTVGELEGVPVLEGVLLGVADGST